MGGRDGHHFGEDDLFGLLKLCHHHVEVPACKRWQSCRLDGEALLVANRHCNNSTTSQTYIWVEPARKGKDPKIGNFTLYVLGLLTTYICFALLDIVMCLKHIEASHIMTFNS